MASRTIETDIRLTGEKEFNQQMKALNNGLKTTRSEMAAVSAEYADNADSMEALTAKQRVLQRSVAQHREKVDALRKQYEAAAAALGEESAATQKYKQQLNYATAALSKEERALEETTTALEEQAEAIREVQRLGGTYTPITERMGNTAKQMGRSVDQAKSELREMAAAAVGAARHVPVLGEAMDIANVSVKGLGKAADVAKKSLGGIGKIAGGTAKGIGVISAASVAGVAALAAGGVAVLTKMAGCAKEAADAAKAASEAGEPLTESQQKWLAFSGQLDSLDASVQTAKNALGNVLLPALSELAGEGTSFLMAFSQDLDEAAGDTEKQGQVIGKHIALLAEQLVAELPEFVSFGKELIAGLGTGLSESSPELVDDVFSLVMDILSYIIDFAPSLSSSAVVLIEKLAKGLTDQGPELVTSAADMVTKIVLGLAKAAPDLIPAAVSLVAQLAVALIASAPDLLLAGLELVYGVIQGIANAGSDLVDAADGMIETITTAFADKADDFLKIGSDILAFIREGIESGWSKLTAWFTDLWDSLFGNLDLNVNLIGGETVVTHGSHYSGLDYVPFDDYIARLHKGEMVLNHTEAEAYRRNRGQNAVQQVNHYYFYAKTLSESDVNMVLDLADRRLGDKM